MIKLYLLGVKGLECLRNLDSKYSSSISEIVIGQDVNVQKDYSDEIALLAQNNGLKFSYRDQRQESEGISLSIAIGWRWMINPRENLIVFHDSILPKYRGFNPLVSALINGDNEIGATALRATENYDRGAILAQKKVSIKYPIKIENAIKLVATIYVELFQVILADFFQDKLTSYEQNEDEASYSLWRDEKDYEINWSLSATEIKRFIDATGYPYKGSKTKVGEQVVRIFDSTIEEDIDIVNRTPGKVIFKEAGVYFIVCGKGLLSVAEFYDESGNVVDFKNSFRLRFGQ